MKLRPFTCSLIAVLALIPAAHAAKFTYHGDLMDGDAPAQGHYDLRLRSFTDQQRQHPLGEATEVLGVVLIDGSFSAQFDLPEDADGVSWIEVAVRKSATGAQYVTLGEAQPMPQANSTCPGAWALDGNSGAPVGSFLGYVDNTSLVLKANNATVATFTPRGTVSDWGDAPSVVSGSSANSANAFGATVSGGGATRYTNGSACPNCNNAADGNFSTVGGGLSNTASGFRSTVGGGMVNTASGADSTVSGGYGNCAGGVSSWAGGRDAKVRPGSNSGAAGSACDGVPSSGDANGDEGSFVWADYAGTTFSSNGPNQFLVRAAGGVMFNAIGVSSSDDLVVGTRADGDSDADLVLISRAGRRGGMYVGNTDGAMRLFVSNATGDTRYVFGGAPQTGRYLVTGANGAHLTTGGAWTNGSSRTFKHAFEAIDVSDVLARVVALPLTRWEYRQSQEGKHLGPMAEDFAAAFGLGGDTEHISTIDADGVALAAIQGLNAKLEAENANLRATLDAVMARLEHLETRQGE